MRRPTTRPLGACLLALTLAPGALAATGGRPIEVETIRVGFDESYKVGTWTPVWVQARAGVEAFDGTMEVVADDESGTPVALPVTVHVGAGDTARLAGYIRPGSNSGQLAVRFLDREGKAVASFDLDTIRPNKPPRTIFSDDIALLALGRPQGVEILPTLPGLNGGRNVSGASTGSAASVVEVVRPSGLDGGLLPGRPIGYDAFDGVVVDTNDKDLMAALAVQGEALRAWVAQGGHLVVAVGSNWQVARDSVLGPMLPGTLAGTVEINDVRTIEVFAAATNQLEARTLRVAKLEGVEARGGKVLCSTAKSPVVVRGPYGFGRVTVVAFDADLAPFATWPDRGQFWLKALDLHPTSSGATGSAARGRITQQGVHDLSTILRTSLEQFPGVKLVPFGWVAFFIFVYILLVGPGDYFFLRKVLKRMELTWVTFPTIVLVVSGLAYWAAYKAKGTELRVNQVDVVDVDVPGKLLRGASFVNVFSPQNRDYVVAIVPEPLRGDAMPPGTEARIGWFGAPEAGPRGMNGGGRALDFGHGGYRYEAPGRPDRLEGVRIPIWSTKAFTARWYAPIEGEPIVESDLTPSGLDRLNGTVTNRLDVPLKNAVLAFNQRVYYNLGDLQPGELKRVELTPDRTLNGFLTDKREAYNANVNPYAARPSISRTALMAAVLLHDSQSSGVEAVVPSRPLHDLDLTGQLLLDRPILMAEIDRPASRLDLGKTAPPKADRTTLIRVILPLGH